MSEDKSWLVRGYAEHLDGEGVLYMDGAKKGVAVTCMSTPCSCDCLVRIAVTASRRELQTRVHAAEGRGTRARPLALVSLLEEGGNDEEEEDDDGAGAGPLVDPNPNPDPSPSPDPSPDPSP